MVMELLDAESWMDAAEKYFRIFFPGRLTEVEESGMFYPVA